MPGSYAVHPLLLVQGSISVAVLLEVTYSSACDVHLPLVAPVALSHCAKAIFNNPLPNKGKCLDRIRFTQALSGSPTAFSLFCLVLLGLLAASVMTDDLMISHKLKEFYLLTTVNVFELKKTEEKLHECIVLFLSWSLLCRNCLMG